MKKKKQSFKRFFAMLLSLVMLMTSVQVQPLKVQAEEPSTSTYCKVESEENLSAGDKIIIVAAESDYALSTEQKTNNRDQAEVTKSDDGKTVTFGSDVQIITLEAGNVEGTFAFNVGNGYLYAASGSSNHLKTKTDLDGNGSWKIEISNEIASVVAQGENSRNVLRYNATSGLFSCYASGQKDIVIYKAVASNNGGGNEGSGEGTVVDITGLTPIATPSENLAVETIVTFSLEKEGTNVEGVTFETSSDQETWLPATDAKYTIPEGEAGTSYTLYVRAKLEEQKSQTLKLTYTIPGNTGSEGEGGSTTPEGIVDGTYVIYDAENKKAAIALAAEKTFGYLKPVNVTVNADTVSGYGTDAAWTIAEAV